MKPKEHDVTGLPHLASGGVDIPVVGEVHACKERQGVVGVPAAAPQSSPEATALGCPLACLMKCGFRKHGPTEE